MVGLVEDIVDANAWNKLEHPAHREGMGGVQIYEPMALGVNDTWGMSFVSTSWKSVAPVSLIAFCESTCTGVVVDFSS